MFRASRRTAIRVRGGKVQRKNRCARTPNYLTHDMPSLVIDRQRPGFGYRHVVCRADVRRFITLLPNWDELAIGLNAIVIARGDENCMGWHRYGVVAVCAWDWEIRWGECCPRWFSEHWELIGKLEIPTREAQEYVEIEFTPATARAFLLVHVLVHELGHHYDRITTRSKRYASRGEPYAEKYARRHEDVILDRYRREFEL